MALCVRNFSAPHFILCDPFFAVFLRCFMRAITLLHADSVRNRCLHMELRTHCVYAREMSSNLPNTLAVRPTYGADFWAFHGHIT